MTLPLFAFGSNGNGQLGIASDEDTCVPQQVHLMNHHCQTIHGQSPFFDFASGGNHTALITREDQRLFMTGSNKDNESLLLEPTKVFQLHETPLQLQEQQQLPEEPRRRQPRWRSVACGWAFTIAVTEPDIDTEANCSTQQHLHQEVVAWGSGSFGELGLGPGLTKTGRQALVIRTGLLDRATWTSPDQFEILKVRAGLRHVLLLAKETTRSSIGHSRRTLLMAWGSNRQGQLGILERPQQLEHTALALTEKELRGKFLEPMRVVLPRSQVIESTAKAGLTQDRQQQQQFLPEIIDVACGQNHSLILCADGTVYASGCNKYGQLGPSLTRSEQPSALKFRIGFEIVQGLPYVDSISCGWNHNAAMDTRGRAADGGSATGSLTKIYLWGRNDHGQLGAGTAIQTLSLDLNGDLSIPPTIVEVRIPKNGAHGANAGVDSTYEDIVSFSCGSEHTLAMTRSGHCYAWGWNEHGNCGSGEGDEHEDLKDVPAPRRVQFPVSPCPVGSTDNPEHGWVTGGYGSSWVWMPAHAAS
ncbi:hypothetical protein BGZ72_004970 [Mortierella alpina]|nr:hypothetical protein BGZ72_004970 [Mortierella alpina]